MKFLLLSIIKFYQYFISPLLGQKCRFHPSCSSYCKEALTIHPLHKAIYLGTKRVCKCHPFNEGGYDPVPKD
ncbi:membrane protein insertion efficiency factor YidD [Halobacteriovorax sp. HLS]|uniref:membrane protein insertion efficiency factor YidD n=1 Tax=Halobacteriovorax sp. HLS TaxID=2234000 RepID=UPI000FD93884|nr:membrane protein insertion efficiency factor YidD [Halobacteriovorax sp. HLS]